MLRDALDTSLMAHPDFTEGELAYHAGVSIVKCPFGGQRGKAWKAGYRYAVALEAERAEMIRRAAEIRRDMES